MLRVGVLEHDEELIDDALNQYYWHIKYLQNPSSGLWYHGYDNIAGDHMSGIYWGRANAWAAFTMSQVGGILPQCYLYPKYIDEAGSLNEQLAALKVYQTENGLWRTVVDDPESYEEISASAGIAAAMLSRGNPLHSKYINKAIKGLLANVSEDGKVMNVSGGTAVMRDKEDYRGIPKAYIQGWGQMLPAYLDARLSVSNHSHSGLTTDTFRKEGHYAVIEQYSRPGDYVFYQFGHNDQKLPKLQAKDGYQANLHRYIKENQARGVYPVLVTPIARNTWRLRDQTYLDLLEEFADVCLELGAQYNIPVLDLHAHSKEYVLEKGLQDAKPIFFPGDYTHTNDFGAYKMAGYVAEEIREKCSGYSERAYAYLAECVTKGFGAWDPVGQIKVPKKPEIYKDIPDPAGDQVLLSEAEQLERVVRLCLKEELL